MIVFRWLLALVLITPLGVAAPLADDLVRQVVDQLDRQLVADVQAAGKVVEPVLDDGTFARRAYLAIVGRIPSAAEAKSFIDDRSAGKRERLIDALVASPGFDSHLFNWAADLLRVQTRGDQYGLGWHVWLRQSLAADMPWDQLVADMLRSTGHSVRDPAVGYYLRDRNMQLDNFSNTMQVFLGRQIGCAQCHDHPFDDWSQYEYYQMAAFTGGMEYRSEDVGEMMRRVSDDLYQQRLQSVGAEAADTRQQRHEIRQFVHQAARDLRPFLGRVGRNAVSDGSGRLRLPADYKYKDAKPGEVVPASTLFGPKIADVAPDQRKQAFAAWTTSRENPYFTTAIVNRLWQRTFGFPLLDSLDNLGEKSKTAHPEVLALLEQAMKRCDYDLRQFSRILFHTTLFERACMRDEPVAGQPLVFSGMVLRRMSAEQLYDSLLMLRHGAVEDTPSREMEASWSRYVGMVESVFGAGNRDLLRRAESAQQGEQRLRQAREVFEKARTALAEAQSPHDRMAAQVAFKQAREAMEDARQQANPLMMPMMSGGGGRDSGDAGRRASDLPAPFQPGSIVREFGGSDRETPSSGHTAASVPQALALLNNWQTDVLGGKNSRLRDQLRELDSPEARLDWLFLTIFGEAPDRNETPRYLQLARDAASWRDLATAMVNSKRFLFIQ